jgi:predicted nuclease with TOPRIM domain
MNFDLTEDFVRDYESSRKQLERELEKINRLTDQETQLRAQLSSLEDKARQNDGKIRELENQAKANEATLREARGTLDQKNEQLEKLRPRATELEAALDRKNDELKKLRARAADLSAGHDQKNKEIEKLRARLAEVEATIGPNRKELEKLRARATEVEAALDRKNDEIKKLRAHETDLSASLDPKNLELKKLRARATELEAALNQKNEELDAAQAELTRSRSNPDTKQMARLWKDKVHELRAKITEEIESNMDRIWDTKIDGIRAEIVEEIEAELTNAVALPLRIRLAVLVFDVIFLFIAIDFLKRTVLIWNSSAILPSLFLVASVGFSLRTFISPGRMLLGISPRRIGSDFQPTRSAGLFARFFAGLLHYGPWIATTYFVAANPAMLKVLGKLKLWAMAPYVSKQTLPSILSELFQPSSSALVLAMTLGWSGVLLLSLLLSRWVHRSTPYFWNTTLVEAICRIGFERFSWPHSAFESSEEESENQA